MNKANSLLTKHVLEYARDKKDSAKSTQKTDLVRKCKGLMLSYELLEKKKELN